MITARECLAVVARRAELTQACLHLEAEARQFGSTAEREHRVKMVRKLLTSFERRWGFTPHWRTRRSPLAALFACLKACACSGESEDERLERLVRAKVTKQIGV
jgi:hypothetical protein